MAKARSPDRDKAFNLWRESGGNLALKEIADQLGVSEGTIRSWKNRDKWDFQNSATLQNSECNVAEKKCNVAKKSGAPRGNKNAKGHGAPVGNQNGLGNNGGPPKRNKNAVTTGEFETIWLDCLTDDEQYLYEKINTDELAQVEEAIRLTTLRERRMLKRIQDLMNGLSEKARSIVLVNKTKKEFIQVHDEKTGQMKVVNTSKPELAIQTIDETEYRKIDDILKLEEALTRIQDKKSKQIQLKHNLEFDKKRIELEEKRVEIMAKKHNLEQAPPEAIQFIDDIGSDDDESD
jgi:uncharacterized protein YjcR